MCDHDVCVIIVETANSKSGSTPVQCIPECIILVIVYLSILPICEFQAPLIHKKLFLAFS